MRTTFTLLICLALTGVGCTADSGEYDPDWTDNALAGGKADGLLDIAPEIEMGGSAAGQVGGDNLNVFRIQLARTDRIQVTMRVTSGDLNPHLTLYRGTNQYIGSESWERVGDSLVKTYVAESAGTYLFVARAYRGEGQGDYDLSVACAGGFCAGEIPPPTEDELYVGDIESCLADVRMCAFAELPSYGGRVGEARSQLVMQGCLDTVQGGECQTACDWVNPDDDDDRASEICADIERSLPFYADQSPACITTLDDCMEECTSMSDGGGDYLYYSPLSMCWKDGFNGTCDGYARSQEACGGEVLADSAGACTSYCHATTGVWYDDLDTLCSSDSDCESYCDVDVAAASAACGGTNAAQMTCVYDWLDENDAYICEDGILDTITYTLQSECSYSLTSPLGDTSANLREAITRSRTITHENSAYSTGARQIVQAALQQELTVDRSGYEQQDQILDQVDDETIHLSEIEIDGVRYDWVRFYLGDTEVGSVFTEDGLVMVGEISDGDLMGCRSR